MVMTGRRRRRQVCFSLVALCAGKEEWWGERHGGSERHTNKAPACCSPCQPPLHPRSAAPAAVCYPGLPPRFLRACYLVLLGVLRWRSLGGEAWGRGLVALRWSEARRQSTDLMVKGAKGGACQRVESIRAFSVYNPGSVVAAKHISKEQNMSSMLDVGFRHHQSSQACVGRRRRSWKRGRCERNATGELGGVLPTSPATPSAC